MLAVLAGCSRTEEFNVAAARSSATKVLLELGREQPEQTRYLKTLVELAEGATVRERAEWFWRRDDAVIAAAWGRVSEASLTALAELKKYRESTRNTWVDAETKATEALGRARDEAKAPGISRREIGLVQQASVSLETARRLAIGGDLVRAAAVARTVMDKTDEVHDAWEALHARFEEGASLRTWRALVEQGIRESEQARTTVFVVDKLKRRLDVYSRGSKVASFPVELGARGLRRKLHSGDRATPEGRYRVTEVRGVGATRYYKALMLDYPNSEDRARYAEARRRGAVPRGAGPGSLIEIHGYGGKGKDWTDGCIALTNDAMDRLFRFASVNTPVVIVGTIPEGKRGK